MKNSRKKYVFVVEISRYSSFERRSAEQTYTRCYFTFVCMHVAEHAGLLLTYLHGLRAHQRILGDHRKKGIILFSISCLPYGYNNNSCRKQGSGPVHASILHCRYSLSSVLLQSVLQTFSPTLTPKQGRFPRL